MFDSNIIADSINQNGTRLTTYVLEYPRFIHSELLTHRVISRNSSSNRAMPTSKVIEHVRHNPAMPCKWGLNQKGMQAYEVASEEIAAQAAGEWHKAKETACYFAESLRKMGLHKQIVNRLLEPFQTIRTIATASNWESFFELRAHPDAQPEIQELAYLMLDEYRENEPFLLLDNEWHLPFNGDYPKDMPDNLDGKLNVCVARCARVSYMNFEGKNEYKRDKQLAEKLQKSTPIHASPFEHCAMAVSPKDSKDSRNFGPGWMQLRALIESGATL